MVASIRQGKSLSFLFTSPIWSSREFKPISLTKFNHYSHLLKSFGGYWSADLSFSASRSEAENWFINGLGKDLKVFSPALVQIFNGFVDKISVSMGGFQTTIGPLLSTPNKVNLVYSSVDTTTSPPVVGNREFTGWVEDTDLQVKYGIIEKVLSAGGISDAMTDLVVNTYLAENKYPKTDQTINLSGVASPIVTLSILGYIHFLNVFTYTDTTTGTRAISTRIQDIFSADPSSRFSTDYAFVEANASTLARYTNDMKLAMELIKGAVSMGDAAYNRYLLGVYQDRMVHYTQAPTDIEYYYNIGNRNQFITRSTNSESIVNPYNVMPGKWLFVSDWLVGDVAQGTDLAIDPRAQFIEEVTYTAPDKVSIRGSKLTAMPQLLGQLGLTGIS